MAQVSIERIFKSFGDSRILHDVSLDVRDGEFLTLLGPSGCGKSTLLRVLAGLEAHDAGRVSVGGRDVTGLGPKVHNVAMVFQSYALYPHLTVAQNIAVPLVMRRLNGLERLPLIGRLAPGTRVRRRQIAADVRRTARALGLEPLLGRKPGQLSGGQRQRVALGRAMVREPSLLLMDEPLSNLDAKLRVQMRAEIVELHRRLGVAIVYVTHDQSEAMTMADRIAVMSGGRILQVDTPRAIYERPLSREVAEFVGSPKMNMLSAEAASPDAVILDGRRIPLATGAAAGEALTVGLRPEALRLGAAENGLLAASVSNIEYLGADLFVHLRAAGCSLIARLDPAASRARIGDRVGVNFDAADALVFGLDGYRMPVRGPALAVPA